MVNLEHKNKFNLVNIKNYIILSSILFLALILRIYNLGKYSFWYDEAVTVLDKWGITQLPNLDKLLDANFLTKNFEYLRFLYGRGIVYYWGELFGRTEFALRMSSVMLGILSIYSLYKIGESFFNIRIARLASLLLAISPFHIFYSQELSSYTAACFLSLLSVYLFLMILRSQKIKYWLLYIIVNILNIYFRYMAILMVSSCALFLVLNFKKYKGILKIFILSCIIIIFFCSPIFLTLYPNMKFILGNDIDPSFSEFPIWANEKISLKYLIFTFKNFSIGYNNDFFSFTGWLAMTVYFALFLIGVFKSYKNLHMQLILFCLFAPILLLFSLSQIKACYVDRYFFPVFPLYLLIVAIALNRINRKIILISAIAFIIGLNFIGLRNYYSNQLPEDINQFVGIGEKQDIRGLVRVILENFKNGDRIMHISKNTVFPLKFYIRQRHGSPDLIHETDKGTVIFISDSYEKGKMFTIDYDKLHPTSFLPEEYSAAYKELSASKRLWIIFSDFVFPVSDGKEYEVIKRLKNNFKEIKFEKFDGAFLYLFSKK